MQLATDLSHLLGEWHTVLRIGSTELRLHVGIASKDAALLTSIDQGNSMIDVKTHFNGNNVRFELPSVKAKFEGTWNASANQIEGRWHQNDFITAITWTRTAAAAASSYPPFCTATIEKLREDAETPALVAAASQGTTTIMCTTGTRSCAHTSPAVTDADQWHVGSQTKSMTATLVGRLVDLGLISWDTTISNLLGEAIPKMRAEYRDVTFLHLLSHRGGLHANLPHDDFMRFSRELDDAREERVAWARLALSLKPLNVPGKMYSYSNSGYIVVGAMLEAKLGAPWEALLIKHVCVPLGLASIGFGAPGAKGSVLQPIGHAAMPGGALRPHAPGDLITDNPAALGPAGRVHLSLGDLIKYLAAHRDRSSDFLQEKTWRTLHTPPFGGKYALGWELRPQGLWHNGSNTLFYSEMCIGNNGRLAAAATNCTSPEAQKAVGAALLCALRSPLSP